MSKVVTVFGSSAPVEGSQEYSTARECGKLLAEAGFALCSGGYGGIMEASARGASEAGGQTIGVTVEDWHRNANRWIRQEVKTGKLIDRLMKLVELGDAYVILPGGTGTLLEFACVLEFVNKDLIARKPIVLLGDFWSGVVETLKDEPASTGLNDFTRFLQTVRTPIELVHYLRTALGT
jgi:uncharacterized protein (TIGR00730 family)